MLAEDSAGRGGSSTHSSCSLANTDLVPHTCRHAGGETCTTSQHTEHCPGTPGRASPPSPPRTPTSSRLACLGKSYSNRGLLNRVIEMLNKSWRHSTEVSYSRAWRLWDSWCTGQGICPFSAPLNAVLDFLLEQFNVGKQYRTINTIHSAISTTHEHIDGVAVGQHPLVTQFFRGVFNSRSPAPLYSSTWDVNRVLSYLKSLSTDDPCP